MLYNVLWIDDDWQKQKDIIGEAEQEGINIHPFESHEEGMVELEEKLHFYHAVLLDAKVKYKQDDITTGLEGLRASRDKLIELNQKRYIPYFIFTGQPDYMNNEMFEQSYGKYYIKGEDNEALYKEILNDLEKHPEVQAKLEYPEPFKPFDNGVIPQKYIPLLIKIVESLRQKDYRKVNLNVQRDLLEAIFISLNNPIPCIPDSLFNKGAPRHEWCTRYMEDRHTKDGNNKEHKLNKSIPQNIKSAFRKLKESTNGYSHLSDSDIVKIPFLANTFLLMEILEWLPEFVERNYKNYI
ncbi:hypothetical protein [Galbibacter orientalis]|uniref:hypothetical protein n=1 Tax=Galbibacter orientalis TaxID=453852 RepID=UPI003080E34E